MPTYDASSDDGLATFDKHLLTASYVGGYTPSASDAELAATISGGVDSKYKNVARWLKHIRSFSDDERKDWGGASTPASAAAEEAEDDDDDFDLFDGEIDEEELAKQKAEKEQEAMTKKAEYAKGGRSSIVLDIKPWEADTDLVEMERLVRAIKIDGLEWKASELKPVAFGVKKLVINLIAEDDKLSMDVLEEKITELDDFVQSVDTVAFNKL